MKNILSISSLIALVLAFTPYGTALADGVPVIIVEPSVAAPGDQITITGTDMEEGEVFVFTLEGAAGAFDLGEATAVPDGEEAGFTVVFTLPSDLATGSYLVRAVTDEGETATADLTIGASSESMNAEPMEASAELLALDRSKPPLLIGSMIVLVLLTAGLGVWLIRKGE